MEEPKYSTEDNNIRFIIESALAKLEKANTRLWIVVIILIVALLGTNAGWIWFESQWNYVDTTTQTITQEATSDGNSEINLQGVGGDYYGGESKADDNQNNN